MNYVHKMMKKVEERDREKSKFPDDKHLGDDK